MPCCQFIYEEQWWYLILFIQKAVVILAEVLHADIVSAVLSYLFDHMVEAGVNSPAALFNLWLQLWTSIHIWALNKANTPPLPPGMQRGEECECVWEKLFTSLYLVSQTHAETVHSYK